MFRTRWTMASSRLRVAALRLREQVGDMPLLVVVMSGAFDAGQTLGD